MLFALGYVAGVATCAFIATLIAFFKQPIESAADRVYRQIQENARQVGASQRGFIYEPPSDAALAREEIVRANAEQGKDTPIAELM